MVSVPLRFLPPDIDNLVSLKIWESAVKEGPFILKATVAPIGSYPEYIDNYTLTTAVSVDDWFAISWVDSGGAESSLSAPVKGGTTTLVGEVVFRVLERDRSLDPQVVRQDAEAVVQHYFSADPYDTTLSPTYRQLNGLVLLVLARQKLVSMIEAIGSSDSFTIGLVSGKNTASASVTQQESAIKRLLDLAMSELGVSQSVIMQLAEPELSIGLTSYDHSRLVGWVGVE